MKDEDREGESGETEGERKGGRERGGGLST